MTVTDTSRHELLESYGRWYGEERFAVAFTAALEGEDAKRVITPGWDQTAQLATPDYAAGLIANRGKTRNVAIVLRPSNLVVLECDTEDDLLKIESLGLPVTITVRSSLPYKRHFYFRPPETLARIPHVAFRFESGKLTADTGRYFLAPPSIHPSGAIYAFLPERGPRDVDIAELPEAVYR
ncbi:MAG: bifunctional DNA primase/polymerase, partial [Gemmatimonadaceae bacterium]|nr:bifunctional DNA primase/polymerase [Gemmatimonadaceae bacterium]